MLTSYADLQSLPSNTEVLLSLVLHCHLNELTIIIVFFSQTVEERPSEPLLQ